MLDVGQINSSHQSSAGGARRGLHSGAIDTWREDSDADRDGDRRASLRSSSCIALATKVAIAGDSACAEFGYRLSYLAHLGGVLLVNPRRPGARQGNAAAARARRPCCRRRPPNKVTADGDPVGLGR